MRLTGSLLGENQQFRLSANGEVASFRKPSNMANGNTRDALGRLISCEHATSRVTRTEPDGSTTILAEHFAGQQLNSPNDVVVGPSGHIYFSDPNYGRNEYFGVKRSQELAFQGVFRVKPDGTDLTLLAYDFDQPNGLCFSRDGARLFRQRLRQAAHPRVRRQPNGRRQRRRTLDRGEGRG